MLPYSSSVSLWCNADVIYKLIRRILTNSVSSSETNQINLDHLSTHITAPSPFPHILFFSPLGIRKVNILVLQQYKVVISLLTLVAIP